MISTSIICGPPIKNEKVMYWELEVFFQSRERISRNIKKLMGVLKDNGIVAAKIARFQDKCGAVGCAIVLSVKGFTAEGIVNAVKDAFGKEMVSISSKPIAHESAISQIPEKTAASLDAEAWGILIRSFSETLGTGASASLYTAGMEIGELSAKRALLSRPKQDRFLLLMECLESFQNSGWGSYQIVKNGSLPYDLEVRMFNCLECRASMAISGYDSPFTRGQLTGMVRCLFNENLTVTEKACTRKGEPYCAFIIG